MTTYQSQIKEQFDRMKGKDPQYVLSPLSLQNDQGQLCGFLRPITKDYRKKMPELGDLLAQWRNEHPEPSANAFTATAESTEKWLDEQILQRDDRILFLIENLAGEKIGHIGYANFDFAKISGEVDAVLRGNKTVAPGIMTAALNSLLYWGIKELRLDVITLRIGPENAQAIAFFKKNYFLPIDRTGPEDDAFLSMKLDCNEWLAAYQSI